VPSHVKQSLRHQRLPQSSASRRIGRFGFFAAHPETHILSLHEHNLYR
jgi:hypothetical protein